MRKPVWQKALKTCADPQRARQFLEKLEATSATPRLQSVSADQARILTVLFSGSQALSEQLLVHPDWLTPAMFDPELLRYPRRKQGMRREVDQELKPHLKARDYPAAFSRLRQFKQREMLRIAARDLARLSSLEEITREISDVADVCLESVYQLALQQLTERFGQPYHPDPQGGWHPTEFSVIGLGKLGGQELNYSSDVDVVFLYSDEGVLFRKTPAQGEPAGGGLTNHQFFARLAESIIAEVGRMTPDGMLFRIDLRLRPEGNAGPLVRSLASYENYYAQWGQTWERMMLIKARGVAGSRVLAGEFMEMIQPFRFPRSLGERILREVSAMKQRIETEIIKAGEIDRNVKLGRGGIREIEFIVQTLQLLNAGRVPFLQGQQTLPILEKLVQYNVLAAEEALALSKAYCFLREVEHRLQMEADLQTHTIPTEPRAKERLAALMGFPVGTEFEPALREHTGRVRHVYDRLLKTEAPAPVRELPAEFEGAEVEWNKLLAQRSFRDPEKALRLLKSLVHGPGYVHVSSRTVDLAWEFLPRLLALCPIKPGTLLSPMSPDPASASEPDRQGTDSPGLPSKVLSDPDRVLARLDSFVTAYGARSMLFEMWASKPALFELLLLLFDRSEFLAEIAIRVPDLVDDLELSGRLRRAKNAEETLKDLRHGLEDPDQRLWIRRYHQAEFMRIGLRDILGLADFEQNLAELTALAEACLQYALEAVLRESRLATPPFAIIGLGKLGGAELTYGSDLDLLFVADSKSKNLAPLQTLAVKIMDLLSSPTEFGVAFATDARLRPDGPKGLLVNTLAAYEDYYRHRAMLWEIQTLTRARPVAGDMRLGHRFEKMAAALTNFSQPSLPLAAYTPAWKQEIARMRRRIEKERVPAGRQALAFKTGAGGLVDAEFIAQTLCLAHGWQEPNTLRALERARAQQVLSPEDALMLIDNYRKLRRIEGILRRWSYVGETELPDDPAPLYRVAVRCGFANAPAFMNAVTDYRRAIRRVYDTLLGVDAAVDEDQVAGHKL